MPACLALSLFGTLRVHWLSCSCLITQKRKLYGDWRRMNGLMALCRLGKGSNRHFPPFYLFGPWTKGGSQQKKREGGERHRANWQQRKDFKTYPEQQKKRNFLAQRSSNRFSSDKKNRRWQNNTGKEKANEKKEESFESRRHW